MKPLDVCKLITTAGEDSVKTIAQFHKSITQLYTGKGYSGLNVDYSGFVGYLNGTTYNDLEAGTFSFMFYFTEDSTV